MRRLRLSTLAAVVAAVVSLTLTGFTPSPHADSDSPVQPATSQEPRRNPSDPAAEPGYLKRLQSGAAGARQSQCVTSRAHGKKTRWCLKLIDPAKTSESVAKIQRNAADPTPPKEFCAKRQGQTNYDRYHACFESVGQIVNEDTNKIGARFRWDVWATLDPKNSTWLMQTGVTVTAMSIELMQTVPSFEASLVCDKDHCKIPAPVERKIGPDSYTYYEMATLIPDKAPGDTIKYTNPQIELKLKTEKAFPGRGLKHSLNDPFNIRCDKERYIGGHGCVYYMGSASAATLYLDYTTVDPNYGDYREVIKNDLYGMVVRDSLNHYGHIRYGKPLHRADPITQKRNHDSICTSVILAKRPPGTQCDEWPYAASEEGGSKNPMFSCAFLPETQNGNHGRALDNNLFRQNRILPSLNEGGKYIQGDPYWVWVLNAPPDNKVPSVKQCSAY